MRKKRGNIEKWWVELKMKIIRKSRWDEIVPGLVVNTVDQFDPFQRFGILVCQNIMVRSNSRMYVIDVLNNPGV